ncbi:MAG: MraY family glycosyltransferase [Candidatus Erginobacter occultus]|nr:MraY family glycosyltransferase [Candidatus Erginobacter occultus]
MSWLVFGIALLASLLLTPSVIRLAGKRKITALAHDPGSEERTVPLLGGIGIFFAFLISTALAFLLGRARLLGSFDTHYLGLLAGGIIILGLGLYDDIRGAKAPLKLIVQALAAVALLLCGYNVEVLTNPFGGQIQLGFWGWPLVIVWVVAVTNAFNLLDGLDGLAAGTAAIAGLILFFSSLDGYPFMPTVAIALVGSCLGFLRYNRYPARIFLGDTGSLFLGFVLAAVSIQSSFKTTAGIALALPLIVLLLPLADLAISFLRRAVRGRNPFRGDRRHLHHKLVAMGFSPKEAVRLFYLLTINLGLIALVMKFAGRELAAGMLFLVGLIVFLFFKIIEDFRFSIKGRERRE